MFKMIKCLKTRSINKNIFSLNDPYEIQQIIMKTLVFSRNNLLIIFGSITGRLELFSMPPPSFRKMLEIKKSRNFHNSIYNLVLQIAPDYCGGGKVYPNASVYYFINFISAHNSGIANEIFSNYQGTLFNSLIRWESPR